MADITNAEAIQFCNDPIRPLAEKVRALKAEVDSALTTWYAGINLEIPNDDSLILDNRESKGDSRMVGTDVNAFVALLAAYQTMLDAGGVESVVSKPCVRTLRVS